MTQSSRNGMPTVDGFAPMLAMGNNPDLRLPGIHGAAIVAGAGVNAFSNPLAAATAAHTTQASEAL